MRFGVPASGQGIYGAIAKLRSDGVIDAVGSLIGLTNSRPVPVIIEERVWGPPESFQPQEIAKHRREAILECFKLHGPLMRTEIGAILQKTDWVRAPLADSLLKADLDALQRDGRVERDTSTEGSWRWKLVERKPTQHVLRLAQ